jgi:hypothetical protein
MAPEKKLHKVCLSYDLLLQIATNNGNYAQKYIHKFV